MRYRRRLTTAILVLAVAHETTPTIGAAQSPPTTNPVDAYVREALRANLSLAQTQLDEDRADAAVREARALRLPSVAFSTRRTRTDGGLDLGTLVNPAYRALNQLTGTS